MPDQAKEATVQNRILGNRVGFCRPLEAGDLPRQISQRDVNRSEADTSVNAARLLAINLAERSVLYREQGRGRGGEAALLSIQRDEKNLGMHAQELSQCTPLDFFWSALPESMPDHVHQLRHGEPDVDKDVRSA